MKPGRSKRYDYEYDREGGSQFVPVFWNRWQANAMSQVTDHRTKKDWAVVAMRELLRCAYPAATIVSPWMDTFASALSLHRFTKHLAPEDRRLG